MIKRNEKEVARVIIRGLSKKYDIMFELDRETIDGKTKTAMKFSCWRHVVTNREEVAPKPHAEEVLLSTSIPGIRQTHAGLFRVRLGPHYLGTYQTYSEAVRAKALYVAEIGGRRGPKPHIGNRTSEELVNS
jgi:hypothetical protein